MAQRSDDPMLERVRKNKPLPPEEPPILVPPVIDLEDDPIIDNSPMEDPPPEDPPPEELPPEDPPKQKKKWKRIAIHKKSGTMSRTHVRALDVLLRREPNHED